MALITRQNQYRGLNAHLHSYLQSKKGDWENFHFQHILHINEVMMDVLDYTQLPVNFHLYSELDQLRILKRMLTVIKAAEQGQDVSQPPLPLADPEISLEEAMRQWELLQSQDQ